MNLITNPITNQLVLTNVTAMLETYAKALNVVFRKPRWSTAMVGSYEQVMWINEAIRDVGIAVDGRILAPTENIFSKNIPLNAVNPGDFDLFILGGRTPQEEAQILQHFLTQFSDSPTMLPPVYLCQKILESTLEALALISELRTCLNPKKLSFISQLLACTPRTGSVAECGVFQGGTTVFMGKLLEIWGDPRRILAFDTFEGMPEPTAKDGATIYQAGLFADSPLNRFLEYIAANGLSGRISAQKGLVQETLPSVIKPGEKISFALVDTDQYAGTIASLQSIVPNLQKNGIIVVDDYDLQGVQEAVAEAKGMYPTLRGAEITFNFYMLWDGMDNSFLSCVQH